MLYTSQSSSHTLFYLIHPPDTLLRRFYHHPDVDTWMPRFKAMTSQGPTARVCPMPALFCVTWPLPSPPNRGPGRGSDYLHQTLRRPKQRKQNKAKFYYCPLFLLWVFEVEMWVKERFCAGSTLRGRQGSVRVNGSARWAEAGSLSPGVTGGELVAGGIGLAGAELPGSSSLKSRGVIFTATILRNRENHFHFMD